MKIAAQIYSLLSLQIRLVVVLLLSCLICEVRPSFSQEGNPLIVNFEPAAYESDYFDTEAKNFGIIQDDFGGILVGNSSGVLYYDGVEWSMVSGAENKWFYKFGKDSGGTIFTGGQGDLGFFMRDTLGQLVFHSLLKNLPDSAQNFGRITRVLSCGTQTYFMTKYWLFSWDGSAFKVWKAKSRFLRIFKSRDELFLDSKEELLKLSGPNLLQVAPGIVLDTLSIRGIVQGTSKQGEPMLFLATYKYGLFHLKNQNLEAMNTSLDSLKIYNTVEIGEDSIVLATKDKGMYLVDFDGNVLDIVNELSGLQNSALVFPYEDREKSVWLALNSGISRVEMASPIRIYNKHNKLNSIVTGVAEIGNYRLFATGGGVYTQKKDQKISDPQFLNTLKIQTDEVWKIYEWGEGKVLVVGYRGIFLLDENLVPQKVSNYNRIVGCCKSVSEPNRVYLAIGDKTVRSIKCDGEEWIDEGVVDSIPHLAIHLQEDLHGNLWASYQNISKIDLAKERGEAGRVQVLDSTNGFSATLGVIELSTVEGQLVFGSNVGIRTFDYESERLIPDSRFPDEFIDGTRKAYKLTETRAGDIWVSTNFQTGLLRKGDNYYTYDSLPIIRVPLSNVYSITEDNDGIVWVGGTEFLIRYDKAIPKNYRIPYYALITKVFLNEDSAIFYGGYTDDEGKPVYKQPESYVNSFPYELNDIAFEFAAPFFDYTEKLAYSHQLVGQDEGWSEWSERTRTEYTNLYEGEYAFKVRARNVYGTISHIAEYRFIILTPWYRTTWAYISYFIAGIIFLILSIWLYTRRLRQAKKRLEGIVKDRTAEVVAQKDEIEEQALELQEANQELVRLGEFKQSLTSMIVHDLKNPLNALINASEQPEIDRQSNMIQQSGRQMLGMVMDILDVHKFEDAQMELNTKPELCLNIVNVAMEQVKFLAEQKGVRLWQETPEELAVNADSEILVRVLVNLLTNAIKFTPGGGDVLVKVKQHENEMVRFDVVDNGPGIEPEYVDKVFSKFGQVTARKSGGVKSTGLGLTFCKMAVEAHGGQIDLETEVGKGTAFWFTVSLSPSAGLKQESEPVLAAEMTSSQSGLKLSDAEREVLLPTVNEIAELPLYKATAIRKALKNVAESDSTNIKAWLHEVKGAVAHMNELKFIELINLVTRED